MIDRDVRLSGGGCAAPGFSLLEVVVVLILLGILAAVAVARFGDSNATALAEAEIFKSHLRYAQIRAMGDIYPWTVTVDSDGYTLSTANASIGTPKLPGESSARHKLPEGVSASAGTFTFNWRGQPTTGGGTSVTFTGDSGVVVTITPETGFAQ